MTTAPGSGSFATDVAGALLAPERPAPESVSNARRFAVYRNNVVVGLIDAIAATYPAVLALVGEDFFRAAAREFVLQNPPSSPILIDYGGAFPDWIAAFPPAAGVPYLGDVSRLEWAWNRAYHAADADPMDLAGLAQIPPEDLAGATVTVHPSFAVLSSEFPVVSLWAQATGRIASAELDLGKSETALVVRPEADVDVRTISARLASFLECLANGETIGQAAEALDGDQDLLIQCLTSLFELRLSVRVVPGGPSSGPSKDNQGSAE